MILPIIVILDIAIIVILAVGLIHRLETISKKGFLNSDDWAILFKNITFSVVVCFPFLQEYAIYHNHIEVLNDSYTHYTLVYKVFCVAFTSIAVWHTEKK